MTVFATLQLHRSTGKLTGRLQGEAPGNPLAAIKAAAPPEIEIVDATDYAILITGLPTTAALGVPISFQVGWSRIGQVGADPFPASPIAVEIEGVSFPHPLDPATHQTTVTVLPEVAGPMRIMVGDEHFIVEVI